MKDRCSKFFVKTASGKLEALQAKTKRYAIEEVLQMYANHGKITIVEKVYSFIESKEFQIDTDPE